MLDITDLTYRISGRTLFAGASARVRDGARVGLVGRNGTGRTTLFRLIAGDIEPESGILSVRKGARIGRVAQEAPGGPESLLDHVVAADTERAALLQEAETATDPARISAIQLRLADIDAHSAEARAATILHGFGFDAATQARPCASFSGGWRMRIALAALLFAEPDLLLLDEPTNYLDFESTLWLQDYLARYRRTVIIISHDRDLLNRAVSEVIHLEGGRLTTYRGGYDSFVQQRAAAAEHAGKARQKQEERRRHMEAFVARFRAKASKARQAQSRLKILARMEPIEGPAGESGPVAVSLQAPATTLASPLIAIEKVAVGYGDGAPILKGLGLRIDADDRIALLGANGNGKSTFAKLIAGRLDALAGTITRAPKLAVAYFAQHQLEELDAAGSAIAHVQARLPGTGEAAVRARVAQMGIATDRMTVPAGDLSGGEKARLLLGLATMGGPHLLILDEPTNHLDIEARQSLIDALNSFEGAVVLISHDRHLVDATADRLWLVGDGTVRPFDGDVDDYRDLVLRRPDTQSAAATDAASRAGNAAERRRAAADARARAAPLKRALDAAEKRVAAIATRLARIDAELTDPAIYTADPARSVALGRDRSEAVKAMAEEEERWLALSIEYETALESA